MCGVILVFRFEGRRRRHRYAPCPSAWDQTLPPVCRHPEVLALVLLGRRLKSVVHCTIRIGHLMSVPDRTDVRLVAGRVARSCDGPPRRACRMELRTADASRVPYAATIEPGLSITAGASSRPLTREACLGASSAGAPVRRSASRSVVGEWSTDVRRSHWSSSSSSWPSCPRGRWPARASRLLRKGAPRPRASGREACSIPHTVPLACKARRTRSENSMSGHGEVAANEAWRGRRGRRRNTTEGARCEEALPAGSADCDRHADSDGDCPANRPAPTRHRRGDGNALPHIMCGPSACRARPRRATPGRTRRGRRCSAPAGRPARRRARAASRPPRTSAAAHGPSPEACRQAVQRISTCG